MVRCSMMPVASGPGVPAPRPKLGFSIDSLVGDGADSACTPARSGGQQTPTPASPEPRRKERSPPRERRDPQPAEVAETLELPPDTDMLQQRLAHERALQERLLAHGLGGSPLGAFGPLAPLARLPLADPRYMKLAQLRGELALGRAGGVPAGLPGLLSHPPAPAAPSEMPLYPWLMSRHGRVFPGRYAPGESAVHVRVSPHVWRPSAVRPSAAAPALSSLPPPPLSSAAGAALSAVFPASARPELGWSLAGRWPGEDAGVRTGSGA